MNIISDNIIKRFEFADSKISAVSFENVITGKVLQCLDYTEFAIVFSRIGKKSKHTFTSRDARVTATDDNLIVFCGLAGGVEIKVTSRYRGGKVLRKYLSVECSEDIFIHKTVCEGFPLKDGFIWSAIKSKRVYVPSEIAAMGQPIYAGDIFLGIESPVGDNLVKSECLECAYYAGRRLSELSQDKVYLLPDVVYGAGKEANYLAMRRAFFDYVKTFSRPDKFRIQFNSWYDNKLDINHDNIASSFKDIAKGFEGAGLRPLDSYVVDDGWTEYHKPLFWEFNEKFADGFYPEAKLTENLGSAFGVWFGPRGGYTLDTPKYAAHLEKIGYPKCRQSRDICTCNPKYIQDLCDKMAEFCRKYNVKYFKIDGFAITPCRSSKHGHPKGRGCGREFYTFLWEHWCKGFEHIRQVCPDVCLNITSYAHLSPWFLKWADFVWMNNASDMDFIGQGRSVDRCLNYRDSRYRDIFEVRQSQFPASHIYNHEPCYAALNTDPPVIGKPVVYTDEEFEKYMKCCMMRGSGLAELYFTPSMLDGNKWDIAAKTLKWAEDNFDLLSNSIYFGGNPAKGEIYGYCAADNGEYIIMLRNSGKSSAAYSFDLPIVGKIEGQLDAYEVKILQSRS